MSITALYVFTPTAFTTDRFTMIESLGKSSPGAHAVVPRQVSGNFILEPGVYRLGPGVSIKPAPDAAGAAISTGSAIAGTPTNLAGYMLSPVPSTKSGWPDPPAIMASTAFDIPMNVLTPFLDDSGEQSVLAAAPGIPGKQANG